MSHDERQRWMEAARQLLPGAEEAGASTYRDAAERIAAEGATLRVEVLQALLIDVLGRVGAVTGDAAPALDELVAALQAELTERDLAAEAAEVAEEERAAVEEERALLGPGDLASTGSRPSLRRRLLEILSWQPRDATELAARLQAPEEAIRELLDRLHAGGLVVPLADADPSQPDVYDVTARGERWLVRHAIHGPSPEPPPMIDGAL